MISPEKKIISIINAYGAFYKKIFMHTISFLFKWRQIVALDCWSQVQILEYICMDYIPAIPLKHLDQSPMNVLVWVHLSFTYLQNENLQLLLIRVFPVT